MKPLRYIVPPLLFAVAAVAFSQEIVRQEIVVGVGEDAVYTTRSPLATVNVAGGASQIVRAGGDQYGQSVSIRGLKPGEAKLLIETTAARIGEVVNVVVLDKKAAARHRGVLSALGTTTGITARDIFASPSATLVTGTTYAATDQARCLAQESNSKGAVVCAARLSSALPAVLEGAGYTPLPSVSLSEQAEQLTGEVIPGSEGASIWTLQARLGDVPFLTLTSADRSALVARSAQLVSKLRRATAEWKKAADEGRPYPVLVSSRRTPSGYEMAMGWRMDQGTRGETLIAFSFDEVQKAANAAGTNSDRLVDWWAALLQDGFRLYYNASTPLRAGAGGDQNPLMRMYHFALRQQADPFGRANAATRLARSYTAMKWSAGSDPFATLLTTVPNAFSGAAP